MSNLHFRQSAHLPRGTLNMWRGQRAEQQHSRRSFDCMLDWLLLLFGTAPCGNCLQESGFSLFSAVRVTGAVWEPAARPALENCVQILSRAVVPNNTRKRIICRMGCRIYLCNVFHYVDVQERRLCHKRPKRKWVRNPFFFSDVKNALEQGTKSLTAWYDSEDCSCAGSQTSHWTQYEDRCFWKDKENRTEALRTNRRETTAWH